MNLMGFDPALENLSRYYAVGFDVGTACGAACTNATSNGAPAVCIGASVANDGTAASLSASNVGGYGAGRLVGGAAAMTAANLENAGVSTVTATTFLIGAVGVIDSAKTTAATADAWSMNQDKRILQVRTGY